MSRSGYTEDSEDQWQFIRWRGAVTSAIKGKRGQAFLKEMLAAMDALPERKLISEKLVDEYDGSVCAIGAVGKARGLDMENVDPEDAESVAAFFGIPHALAAEIEYINDDWYYRDSAEERYRKMREWVEKQIMPPDGQTAGAADGT
jgi:hypothetical protein